MGGEQERGVLEGFRRLYLADRAAGRVRPLESYKKLFPGYWHVIGSEYEALGGGPEASPAAERATPFEVEAPPEWVPGRDPADEVPIEPPPGEHVGPYRIVREVGRGGMGIVYLAEDMRLSRRVALKVLSPAYAASRQFQQRFRREAEVASRIDHPGLCTVYEAGEARGVSFIAMRFVEGRTLAEALDAARREGGEAAVGLVDVPAAVLLVERAARALHAAHEAGLVHRDVKPANLMVTADGSPVILDFGLARETGSTGGTLTRTGARMGTPAYMAPEQVSPDGRTVDRRVDVYSLGATLYECLTLRLPHEAPTLDDLYRRILGESPDDPRGLNPAVSRDLRVVLETALQKDPDARYRTALDLAEDLRRVREMEPIRARPAGPLLRLGRWSQRNPALAGSLAAVFVLLGTGLAVSAHLLGEARDALGKTKEAREAERRQAGLTADALRVARARGLAASSGNVLRTDPTLALLLAREAVRADPTSENLGRLHSAMEGCMERVQMDVPGTQLESATFSPDGERVLLASLDGLARLWDRDGKVVATLRGHSGPVVGAAFSPDGTRVVTASQDGTARLWDREGRPGYALIGHGKELTTAAFSPDGARVVTASYDRTARVWDLEGRCLAELAGHEDAVMAAEFSPDSRLVATASLDRTARVFETGGRPLARLEGHGNEVFSARFSPDGRRVLTASKDGTAVLWGLDGSRVRTFPHAGGVAAAIFSPGGDRVFTASWDRTASLWSLDGASRVEFRGHEGPLVGAVFSPGGECVLTLSADRTARAWDLAGRELAVLRGHTGTVSGGAFSPRRDEVLTFSRAVEVQARLWDLAARRPFVYAPPDTQVLDARYSPDGETVVAACADGTARVLGPDGAERLRLPGHGRPLRVASYSPDGRRILTASEDGTAAVWDAGGKSRTVLAGHSGPVTTACFSPDSGRVLTGSDDGTACIWDREGRCIASLPAGKMAVKLVAWSPDGGTIATAAWDGTTRTWDAEGRPVATLAGAPGPPGSLRFTASGDRLLTCNPYIHSGARQAARLWARDGKQVRTFGGHEAGIRDASFSPGGEFVLTASDDRTTRVWTTGGEPRARLVGHEASVLRASFSPRGDLVVTASADGTARVWDLEGRERRVYRGHVGDVLGTSFSPSGDRVLTFGRDGTIRTWIVPEQELLALADRRLCRDFSASERSNYAALIGDPAAK